MSVAFNTIPSNLLVPFFWAEINSGGTPYVAFPRLLLIGQKTSAGIATAAAPIGPIQGETEAIKQFGKGSMLHAMFNIARRNAPFQPIWALPLADPSGASATGTITVTAPAVTGPGIVTVMGRRIVVQVNAADNATTVAAALKAAVNAANLPVTADNAAGVLTLTARHVGALGNAIRFAVATDEPNVLTTTNAVVVAMSGGSGVPTLDTALANLGDDEYDWLCGPYADTTSLNAIRDFLDGTSGRWAPIQQLYGHYLTNLQDTLSNLVSFGNGRNDPHVSILGTQASPTPPWEWAAALGAVAVLHLANPPEQSRPLQTLLLSGVLPPTDRVTWWDTADRQALYPDGIGGYKVTRDGRVQLDRIVTTYQEAATGVPDGTFRDVETMAQAMWATRYFRSAVSNRHGRQSIADENPYNVAGMTTPLDIRNTLIHAYEDMVALGLTENPDLFARFVVVERNKLDPNRVDAYLPLDVVNQLRVFAANVTLYLQYTTASGQAQVSQ